MWPFSAKIVHIWRNWIWPIMRWSPKNVCQASQNWNIWANWTCLDAMELSQSHSFLSASFGLVFHSQLSNYPNFIYFSRSTFLAASLRMGSNCFAIVFLQPPSMSPTFLRLPNPRFLFISFITSNLFYYFLGWRQSDQHLGPKNPWPILIGWSEGRRINSIILDSIWRQILSF